MKNLAQLRAEIPELDGLSDGDAVEVLHQTYYADLPLEQVSKALGYQPPPPPAPPEPEYGLGDFGRDVAGVALKGAMAVPEAAVGLADLVSGGRAGKLVEDAGIRFKDAREFVDQNIKSDSYRRAAQDFSQSEGVMGKLGAVARNPELVAHAVGESLPSIAGGQLAGRAVLGGARLAAPGLMAGRGGAAVAGGVGEGVMAAGSSAEQIRQQTENGLLTGEQSAIAGGIGVATSVLGAFGNKLAQSLGLKDVDTLLIGAARSDASRKGLVRQVVEGAVAEGFLEELPQSVVEQVAQNLALGKPLDEDVDAAAVLGTLSGSAMGGGAQLLPDRGPLSRAVNKGVESGAVAPGMPGIEPAAPSPALPADGDVVGPNGTVFKRQPDGSLVYDSAAQQQQSSAASADSADAGMGAAAAPLADPLAASPLVPAPGLEQTQPMVARPEVADPFAAAPPDVDVTAPAAPGNAFEQRQADRPRGEEALTDPLPADVTTRSGAPFKTMGAALSAMNRAGGEAAGDIVRVKGGLVIRPKGSANVDAGGGLGVPADAGPAVAGGPAGADDRGGVVPAGHRAPDDGGGDAVAGGGLAADPADPVRGLADPGDAALSDDEPTAEAAAGAQAAPAGEGAAGAAGAGLPAAGAAPVQADGLTRVQVGPRADSFTNINAQAARDQADRLGLTQEIEEAFAEGLPAKIVRARLEKAGRLDRIPAEERDGFVVLTRATLGIPSRGDADGQAEFEQWRAARAARAGAGPVAETAGTQSAPAGPALSAEPAPGAGPAVTWLAETGAPALAETAEEGAPTPAAAPQAELEPAAEAAPKSAPAQENTTAPAPASEVVEHVTGKGKTIRGVWRDDFTERQAKEIDPYSFNAKGKGWFIREKHLAQLPARGEPKEAIAGEAPQGVRERRQAAIEARKQAEQPAAASAPEESSKAPAPSANTLFTQEAYERARARMRSKLGQVQSGVDPETLQDGITLAGYHIERGARTFAAYARAMLGDFGDAIRPYLKSFYNALRDYPGFDNQGMDDYAAVQAVDAATLAAEEGASVSQDAPPADTTPAATPVADAKDLTGHFLAEIKAGRMPKDNPALKKLVEAFDGRPADPARMKLAQEHLEAAIVQRARELVKANPIRGDRATFDALLELYRSQPSLNVRTSTSIANQAYSTPAPLAFLSSRLAGITSESKVLEPTAGTGMLVIGAKPANVHANEIEPTRQGLLLDQGFDVTRRDATEPGLAKPGSMDAVIANPPFGPLDKETRVDGFRIAQIDHLIAARALEAMKDDGRATLILGANKQAGGQSEADRIFLNWLYSHYDVTSHFEAEGDLYARQGAGWPVRVITVNGRVRSSQIAPKVGTIQRASTWEQVYEHYEQSLAAGRARPDAGPALGAGGAVAPGGNDAVAVPPAAGGQAAAAGAAAGASRAPRGAGGVAGAAAGDLQPGAGGSARGAAGSGAAADGHRADAARPDRLEQPRDAQTESGAKPGRDPGAAGALTPPEQANTFQSKYVPRSSQKDEDVLIPVNMAGPLQNALSALEDQVGDIDKFAAKELGYDSVEQMHSALMGLQVDSVAAAIYQIKERGKGVIIADQTGIGKGRQAAAMIRWAMRNGRVPIFMTVGDNLFTSMYDDLQDIGSSDAKPFLINREAFISGEGNERLFTNRSSALHSRVIDRIAATGELPEGANVLFSTYSQINVDNRQRKAIMALADKAVFILDESHKAGGDSATGKFMRGAIDVAPGTVYLSATFAKRPDNMPLYFKTDIGDAMDPEALTAAMAAGGLPLQTVVSANLVAAGQLFRRERSFEGISIVTETDTAHREEHREIADKATEALRAIVEADHAFHTTYFDSLREAYDQAAEGNRALDGSGNQASDSVNRTEFSSVVHNFVRQILLGMTAQTAAEDALAAVKRGERALIAFENTMGSFLNEYAQQNNLKPGDKLGIYDYRNVLTRALERSRYYTLKKANGDKERVQVPLSDLDPETYDAYQRAQEVIDKLQIKLPASPIDWMRHVITSGGHTVKEITGRTLRVDYSDPKAPTLESMPKEEVDDRVLTARQFNGSDGVAPSLDVILLNVAGSTGISLHAAAKFANQSKRHMIVAQAAGDINTFMQMLGRSNRTGQVIKPGYKLLQPDLPAVRRPAAVLSGKMKKLNANTSSNTESATSVEAVDMLNKYGDQIVSQYLADNPQLAQALRLGNETAEDGADATEDIAKKATGRLALMPVAVQDEFYEEVEGQYRALIEYLDKTNQNDLVPRTFDFDAKELKTAVLYEGEKPESPFGADAVYGEYSIKAQGKPMTPAEIRAEMAQNLAGQTGAAHAKAIVDRLEAAFLPWAGSVPEALRDTAEKQRREAREFLQQHPIGTLVRVQINEDPYNAAVVNIRSTHKTAGNPFAMSKIQVTIAVNGALRQVTVPATQFRKIEVANLFQSYRLESLFEAPREGDRETVKIATGNLLAAYGEIRTEGRIISFTKADGTVEQGILLPKKFTLAKDTDRSYRMRTPAQVLDFLHTSTHDLIDKIGANTRDQQVRVLPHRQEGVQIRVPKSKAKGGKYFLDKELLSHTGDFVSHGSFMSAYVEDRAAAEAALARLMKQQALYVVESMAEEARGKLPPAESLSVSDTTSEGGDSTMSSPQNVGDGQPSARDRERAAKLSERLELVYPGHLFDAVAPRAGRGGRTGATAAAATWVAKRLFGHDAVFVRFRGKQPLFNGAFSAVIPDAIFLNADSDKPHLAVLGHELLHRLRRERADLYAQLQTRLARVLKDVEVYRDALAAKYRDVAKAELPDNWMEELHADIVGDFFVDPAFWQAMAADKPGLFRRVANAIVKFLDEVKAALTGAAERPNGTDRFITDLDAARAAVAEAMGEFSVGEGAPATLPDVSLSIADSLGLNNVREAKVGLGYVANDFMQRHGTVSGWQKTVGTPFNLAQKSRPFRRVFDAVQHFLGDTSHYANQAADLAPTILPRLEKLADLKKAPLSHADKTAIAAPIFEGTLAWTRDDKGRPVRIADLAEAAESMDVHAKAQRLLKDGHVAPEVLRMWQGRPMEEFEAIIEGKYERDVLKAGIVWTPEELKSQFKLTDAQAKLYQEFRAAVDRSLNDLAISDMVRAMGKADEAVRDAALSAKTGAEAAAILQAHLDAQLAAEGLGQSQRDELNALAAKLIEKRQRLAELIDRGYAPLMRFGTHAVDVVSKDGERLHFGLYESQREANRAARRMREQFPDAQISQGTTSEEAYKQFAGVTPETLELFGEMLGLDAEGDGDASRAFQTYLRVARSNRDSMKRLIRRKGIAGFNEDVGRVLAGFITSNARRTSANLHTGEIETSLKEIPQGEGQLRDYAGRLVDYVRNPQEEAAGLRGLMFAQFLGGSIASAAVNLTQPLTMTIPFLSQYGGGKKAAARVSRAWADLHRGSTGDKALDAALKQAEIDGVVSPQEIHQLQAQAGGRGVLQGGDGTAAGDNAARLNNAWQRISLGWGRLFGWAEQVNRRTTFIAAYRTAVEEGLGDPVAFAKDAINQTQGVYNKGNRPPWARGAIGATLMCVDEQTEALTSQGWKNLDQLQAGDLIASFDMATARMVWKPVESVHRFDHDGDLIHVRGKSVDMLVTEDHRCVVYRKRRVPGKRDTGETYASLEIQEARDLTDRDMFPTAAPFDHQPVGEPLSDAMVRVLGWVATEGCVHKKNNGKESNGGHITIAQNEGPNAEAIRRDLRDAGFQWTEGTPWRYEGGNADHVRFFISKSQAATIRAALPGKHLSPELLMRMTVEQIKMLVDTMIAGDGCVQKGGQRSFIQNPGPTLECFQMALTMIGVSYSVRDHGANTKAVLLRKGDRHGYGASRTRVHHKGRVWCPLVQDTHTWVARRNGQPFVTHNTFKQFSISYVELLTRLAKSDKKEGRKAALLMVATLMLMSGLDELPFMEDAEDVIDGIAQRALGLDFSTRRARNEFLERWLGAGFARFLAKGVSGLPGFPSDISGRLGMGDLLPGTGFAVKKQDHTRDFESLGGPVVDLLKRGVGAVGKAAEGDFAGAGKELLPVAARNVLAGADMASTGQYSDRNGKKVVETTLFEAGMKAIGFQPTNVSRVQEATGDVQRSVGLVKMEEAAIADLWAKGLAEGDRDKVAEARERLKTWNARNKESRIHISIPQLRRRVRELRRSKAERIAATAPKEIRERVTRELEERR